MPTPTYSVFGRTIVVSVVVVPPSTPDSVLKVHCETIIVPRRDQQGGWRIVWNLVTDSLSNERLAVFPKEGGITTLLCPLYPLSDSHRTSETQWTAVLDHCCEPKVDALSYEVHFCLLPNTVDLISVPDRSPNPRVISHDPTIVVSRDPVEPPSPEGPPTGGG